MAGSIVQHVNKTWNNAGTSATVSLSAAPTPGNIVVAFITQIYGTPNASLELPTGFTTINTAGQSSLGVGWGVTAGYLVVPNGDTGSYTFRNAGSYFDFEIYELAGVQATGITSSIQNQGSSVPAIAHNAGDVGLIGACDNTSNPLGLSSGWTVDEQPEYNAAGQAFESIFGHQAYGSAATSGGSVSNMGTAYGTIVYIVVPQKSGPQTFNATLSDTLTTSDSTSWARNSIHLSISDVLSINDVLGFKKTPAPPSAGVVQHASTIVNNQTTAQTVSLPAAPAAGNLVVAFIESFGLSSALSSSAFPSGWTFVTSTKNGNSPNSGTAVGYHVASAGENGSYTFPSWAAQVGLGTMYGVYELYELSGVTTTGLTYETSNSYGTFSTTLSYADGSLGLYGGTASNFTGTIAISSPWATDDNPQFNGYSNDRFNSVFGHRLYSGSGTDNPTITVSDANFTAAFLVFPKGSGGGSTAATWGASFSEVLPLSDALARANNNLSRALSDTATLSDALAGGRQVSFAPSDTVSMSASIAQLLAATRAASDTLVTADAPAAQQTLAQVLSDSSTLSDAMSTIASQGRSLDETSSFSDVVNTGGERSLSDTMTTGDAVTSGFAVVRALSEVSTVIDSIARLASYNRGAEDTSAFNSALHGLKESLAQLADASTTSDLVDAQQQAAHAFFEAFAMHNALTLHGSYGRTAQESFSTLASVVYAYLTNLPEIKLNLPLNTALSVSMPLSSALSIGALPVSSTVSIPLQVISST